MVTFLADAFSVKGPRQTDGSYTVTFVSGEYTQKQMSELIANLPPMTALKVTVEIYEG